MFNFGKLNPVPGAVVVVAWSIVMFAIVFVVLSGVSIFDHYAFRQTQVATVAREIFRGGPWVEYLMPVLGPPWTAPMEFPLYQILMAEWSHLTGMGLETSGRLISALSAIVSLVLVARLLELAAFKLEERWMSMIFVAAAPMFVYWSHAVMIETLALALSLGFLLCAVEFTEKGRVWPLGLGAVLAVLAALAKATTFGVFAVVVFAIFGLRFLEFSLANRTNPGRIIERCLQWMSYGIGLLAPALLVSAIWVDFADGVKDASPITVFLTSERLSNWNFGPMEEGVRAFKFIFTSFRDQFPPLAAQAFGIFWIPVFLLAAYGLVRRGWNRRYLVIILLIGFCAGPAIFRNLYETHYYYWVANMPFLSVLIALGVVWGVGDLIGRLEGASAKWPGWWRDAVRVVPVAAMLLGSIYTYSTFFISRTLDRQMGSPHTIGELVRSFTSEDDFAVIYGVGWTPIYQYAMDRRVVMMNGGGEQAAQDHLSSIGAYPSAYVACARERERVETRAEHALYAGQVLEMRGTVGSCDVYQLVARTSE